MKRSMVRPLLVIAASLFPATPMRAGANTAMRSGAGAFGRSEIRMNPHLHGATAIAHPELGARRFEHEVRPAAGASEHPRVEHEQRHEPGILHHVWHNRWDYAAWRVTHLHYGEVRGIVVDSSGAPLRGVHVWLQRPGGAGFKLRRRKHLTHTDASGRFLMTRVQAQSYRLATHHGHAQIIVHAGTLATAIVTFDK